MRTIRALTIATAIVAALPTIAAAQSGRGFADSWFWGVKAGGLTIADSGQHLKQAPIAGLEWLITRQHGGIYASLGQAFFTQQALTLRDPSAPADSGTRAIQMKNMRKLDVAVVGFPGDNLKIHPYVGAGFSMSQVADAQPQGPGTADQLAFADSVISQHKVSFAPMFMAGVQYRLSTMSIFGQASMSPMHADFLAANGRSFAFEYEIGLRYNFGSAIDRNP